MTNFKQLRIWQKGFDIAVKAFQLISTFPKEERYGLSKQITRAAVSIASNTAEGSSRPSEKEYGRFIDISLGSSFELETQLLIAQEVNYGDINLRAELLVILGQEQRMLTSFKKTLQK
jgi:four helix bundle protein